MGMIEAIGQAQADVTGTMNGLSDIDMNDPEGAKEMIEQSMKLMQQQQRLSIMSESFTKAMKANFDAAKSAITNMH